MNRFKAAVARKIAEGTRGRLVPMGQRRLSRYGNYEAPVSSTMETSVIDHGSFSPFNAERKMHRNSIKLRIKNPNGNPVARLVISAGEHEAKNINGILLSDHLIQDGVNTYKAADGTTDVPNVEIKAQFGISGVESVKTFQDFIRNKGLLVSSTRFKFQTEGQLLNKIHFNQFDYLGDHGIDYIDPEIEHDPHQYHDKDILIPLKYVLNEDTIMMLDVEPNETVQFTLYMAKYLDLNRLLVNEARREGSNILL